MRRNSSACRPVKQSRSVSVVISQKRRNDGTGAEVHKERMHAHVEAAQGLGHSAQHVEAHGAG